MVYELLTAVASLVAIIALGLPAQELWHTVLACPDGMGSLPGPGIKSISPALAGEFSYLLYHQGSPIPFFP